jgi:hypothetical protein
MTETRYGVPMPDIGCSIRNIAKSGEKPRFHITPNDPAAYARLLELVSEDARNGR